MKQNNLSFKTLTIDIGGSHIKASILNPQGLELAPYQKVETPQPASPDLVLKAIHNLAHHFPAFDNISVGFPGFVKENIVLTAPNLDSKMWNQINLANKLSDLLGKPAKVVNDADLQGLGVVSGKGFEIMITLGTGFGTAFLINGNLLPHIELAHHPITKNKDYDAYIGEKTLETIGIIKWKKRIKKILRILKTVFNYDFLYIGGGNSRLIDFELDDNIKIVTNEDGIKGGAKLWRL